MVYVLRSLVAVAPDNLFVVVKIILVDSLLELIVSEKRRELRSAVTPMRVDALCKAHEEHLVVKVKENVFDGVEFCLATLHEVDETCGSWRQ